MNTFCKSIPWGAVAMVLALIEWMNMRPAHANADRKQGTQQASLHAAERGSLSTRKRIP